MNLLLQAQIFALIVMGFCICLLADRASRVEKDRIKWIKKHFKKL